MLPATKQVGILSNNLAFGRPCKSNILELTSPANTGGMVAKARVPYLNDSTSCWGSQKGKTEYLNLLHTWLRNRQDPLESRGIPKTFGPSGPVNIICKFFFYHFGFSRFGIFREMFVYYYSVFIVIILTSFLQVGENEKFLRNFPGNSLENYWDRGSVGGERKQKDKSLIFKISFKFPRWLHQL